MNRTTRAIAAISLAILPIVATTASLPTATAETRPVAESGFRVLPYLQSPSSSGMTVNWISERNQPGTLTITGPGLKGKTVLHSTPEYLSLMEYTARDLAQEIPGLEQGSWLYTNSNYKHTITLSGLKADHTYRYSVRQGDRTFTGEFTTAPTADKWSDVRVIAFSDTETEPYGAIEKREWELHPDGYAPGSVQRPGPGSLWHTKHGNTTRYGQFTLRYPMDQQRALIENINWIEKAKPDLLLAAGDLAQGSGYQPGWDEFWRHFAGDYGRIATHVPVLAALGNWETYAAINDGYGTPADRSAAAISRHRYHGYFDTPGDPANPRFKDSYYRIDHGPLTVITLDSTNGVPDENTNTNTLSGERFSGDDRGLNERTRTTDTQGEFTAPEYDEAALRLFGESDLPNLNPGTAQWAWAERQLADARAKGQIIVVQFHHAAYSSGVHGTPPNFEHPDNQSGVAMRIYTPLFEKFGVSTVISGHDEMFERSFVDEDGDGIGFHSYDVGVAADGLRGEQLARGADGVYRPIKFNTFTQWSASADEPELWRADASGNPQLVDGGLHYGHLQMDLKRTKCGAEMVLSPVYLFPLMDAEYNVTGTERRVYDDVTTVHLDQQGKPLAGPADCKPGKNTAPGQLKKNR